MQKSSWFTRLAKKTAQLSGRPVAFGLALGTIIVWLVTGPLFGFSDTWQLVINTGTTIVTFLMVFLIQNTQNRDTVAIQIKLDELIRVTRGHNALMDLEELDDIELERFRRKYEQLAARAPQDPRGRGRHGQPGTRVNGRDLMGGLLCAALAAPAMGARAAEDPLAANLAAVREALDPRAAGALARIDGTGRQLLAARSYLRAGDGLAGRWSWSDAEMIAWQGSPAQAALDAAVARVRRAFESANPGYSLHVNPEVRSLEVQLERWNTNDSIAAASRELAEAASIAIQSQGFPAPGTPLAQAAFGDFLRDFSPDPTPPLAAPGLSAHGQMRAVDFVVVLGDRIVAGAVTADIPALWIGQGWGERLKAAVQASGAPFAGPLRIPDEPWHYDYRL